MILSLLIKSFRAEQRGLKNVFSVGWVHVRSARLAQDGNENSCRSSLCCSALQNWGSQTHSGCSPSPDSILQEFFVSKETELLQGDVSGGVSEVRTSGTSQSTSVPRPLDSLLRNLSRLKLHRQGSDRDASVHVHQSDDGRKLEGTLPNHSCYDNSSVSRLTFPLVVMNSAALQKLI